jgi:colanic acid/amylovoran biosynthesis glycosyltransferase
VLTQAARNRDQFPFEPVYSAEDDPVWRRTVHRVMHKVTGRYGGYAPIIAREGAGLIHAHFGQEGCRCLSARRRARVPLVTTFYGLDVSVLPRQRVWRRRFRRLFAEGELFLAEGPCMGDRLVDLGCSPDRVRVQRLGVDVARIPFRSQEARAGGDPVVLMCATFREKKGHVYGLRAFARIRDAHPTARMRVIGDGPLRSEIQAEIDRLNLGDCVDLLGMQPRSVWLEELGQATVLLCPSVTASDGDTEGGAPVVLIEAMAAGVPVVSSRHADIPEVVPDGECGLLFGERDVEGLSEGLQALLEYGPERTRMGRAGRSHVEANHNLPVQAELLEGIYDEVVGGSGRSE